jgi:hypothetical protein
MGRCGQVPGEPPDIRAGQDAMLGESLVILARNRSGRACPVRSPAEESQHAN